MLEAYPVAASYSVEILQVNIMIKLSQKRESLESIPVFAQNMAVRVLAELGDVRRFSNLNKISVFIGIDRERYQSGEMNSKFKHY